MFLVFTVPIGLGLLIWAVSLLAAAKQRQTAVILCRRCATSNRMGAYACTRCGAELIYECPRWGAITPATVVSSHLERKQPLNCSCGTSLLPASAEKPLQVTARCATFQADLPVGSLYCGSCGAAIYLCAICKAVVGGDQTVCACGNRLLEVTTTQLPLSRTAHSGPRI